MLKSQANAKAKATTDYYEFLKDDGICLQAIFNSIITKTSCKIKFNSKILVNAY